jgi:hypothetical protein
MYDRHVYGNELYGLSNDSECNRILTRFCKRAVLFLSDVVSRLVIDCIFSSCFKLAKVVPVLKSGSQLILNNFEHVLHIRLQKYLDAHNVINGYQCGCVHSSNTLLATTSLMSFVRKKI